MTIQRVYEDRRIEVPGHAACLRHCTRHICLCEHNAKCGEVRILTWLKRWETVLCRRGRNRLAIRPAMDWEQEVERQRERGMLLPSMYRKCHDVAATEIFYSRLLHSVSYRRPRGLVPGAASVALVAGQWPLLEIGRCPSEAASPVLSEWRPLDPAKSRATRALTRGRDNVSGLLIAGRGLTSIRPSLSY